MSNNTDPNAIENSCHWCDRKVYITLESVLGGQLPDGFVFEMQDLNRDGDSHIVLVCPDHTKDAIFERYFKEREEQQRATVQQ